MAHCDPKPKACDTDRGAEHLALDSSRSSTAGLSFFSVPTSPPSPFLPRSPLSR